MRIEILYLDGCPNYLPAVERVREVLAQENLAVEIRRVEVADLAHAQDLGFLGSPSVRVNGADVEADGVVSLCCRASIPSMEALRAAIRSATQV